MTADDWRDRANLPDMLHLLSSRNVSKRKALLWNVAVCLRWCEHLDDVALDVLADAQRHADGERSLTDEWELVDRVQQLKGQQGDFHSSLTALHKRMVIGAVEAAIWPRELFGVGGYIAGIEPDEAEQKCRLPPLHLW